MISQDIIPTGEKIQELADCYVGLQSDFEFNPRIYQQHNKFVYLNALNGPWDNPPLIFCYSNRIQDLSSKIHHITNKCIIILGNSDEDITPDKCVELLRCDTIYHIFTQNMLINHPKITSIPIGIANSQWSHGNLALFSHDIIKTEIQEKREEIFCSLIVSTNEIVRKKCIDRIALYGLENYRFDSQFSYLVTLATHKFCICPRGNGVDTHRFWEAQLLKTVPIVDKNPFTEHLQSLGYPCVLIDDWNTFDPGTLPPYESFTWPSCEFSVWKDDILKMRNSIIPQTNTMKSLNVVLSFIGKMPEYITVCISQLRLFYKGPVYLIYSDITDTQRRVLEEHSVMFIEYSEVRSERFECISHSKSFCVVDSLQERRELFRKSYERIYLLEKLMLLHKLTNIWFMEIDIMMYTDPSRFLEKLSTAPYTYCYHDKDHCNTSILFIRDMNGLEKILATLDTYNGPFISEMIAMRRHLETHPDDSLFPLVYPCDVNPYYYKTFGQYDNYLFDGAVMGQYLFGVDAIHTGNIIQQKKTDTINHLLNVWSYGEFIWDKTDDNLFIPYYVSKSDGKKYPIANLHIHSKDLHSASSLISKNIPTQTTLQNNTNELYDIVTCIGPQDIERVYDFVHTTFAHVQNFDKLYIIASSPEKIKIQNSRVHVIDESVFPFKKDDIEKYILSKKRSGWYLQQLLKLYVCKVIPSLRDNFLIVDADVHFHKPISFFEGSIPHFNVGTEYNEPYFSHMNKLLPELRKVINVSGICHLMPITRTIVNNLFEHVEAHHNKSLWISFLENVSANDYELSGASEYEILFTFALLYHFENIRIRPILWRNTDQIDPSFQGIYEACHFYLRDPQWESRNPPHVFDFIDKLYYINLAHRTDRDEQIKAWLAETKVPSEKIQRINSIHVPGCGHLGATASHVTALETFLASDANTCCIFEDDYVPLDPSTYWSSVQQIFDHKVDFECVLLSYNLLKSTPSQYPFLEHVQQSYTASGYIITREFAPKLIETLQMAFRLAVDEESRTGRKTHQYCLDVYWAELMVRSNRWYVLKPRIGKQAASHSDIENHMVDHGV